MSFEFAGPPEERGDELSPWFEGRRFEKTVLFGHWAALGFRRRPGWVSLDSGCVWGGSLTAYRLQDEKVFHQPALETSS
jgi:bis(5'-nucleosyl)-tetraphosphatase (symmetrical)